MYKGLKGGTAKHCRNWCNTGFHPLLQYKCAYMTSAATTKAPMTTALLNTALLTTPLIIVVAALSAVLELPLPDEPLLLDELPLPLPEFDVPVAVAAFDPDPEPGVGKAVALSATEVATPFAIVYILLAALPLPPLLSVKSPLVKSRHR